MDGQTRRQLIPVLASIAWVKINRKMILCRVCCLIKHWWILPFLLNPAELGVCGSIPSRSEQISEQCRLSDQCCRNCAYQNSAGQTNVPPFLPITAHILILAASSKMEHVLSVSVSWSVETPHRPHWPVYGDHNTTQAVLSSRTGHLCEPYSPD